MINKILKTSILGLTAAVSVFFISIVFAQTAATSTANIQYPILQLGNCRSETDCRNFCDKSENTEACLNFAEENNLMPKEEIEMARKFTAAGNKGPGGCTGKDSCESYCNDISNIDECVSFAEQNNFLPPKELEEAKKVRAAIKRGVKPPSCGNKKACDSYCEDQNHMEECIAFAQEAGFMDDRELAESRKVLQAVKRGVKPPPCRGKEACDQYCQQPDNLEVCMNFAIEAGLMNDKEKEDSQKMLSAIKKGIKPPNCRGKTECDSYCQSDEHFDECANFAEAAGFIDGKEAEIARKTRGKGPGGCKGKEECESFCNNSANQEACFKFAEENGLIPAEQINEMKEGMGRMREGLNNAPPEIKDCLKSALGENIINKIQSGELTPGPQIGNQMKSCFDKFPPREMESPADINHRRGEENGPPENMPPEGMPPEGFPPGKQGGFRGPGGCSSPKECQNLCLQNPEKCRDFNKSLEEQGERPLMPRTFPIPPEFSPMPGDRSMDRPPFPENFNQPFNQPFPEKQNQHPQELNQPLEFEGRSLPLPPQPGEGQFIPSEIQVPPPLPPETEQPQSLLNSVYLGAIIRFLLGSY
ncbi:MAG: hypothetical protein HYX20_03565 [Candidatus Yanofskybacteria bacterium]|nr:hypothetical protein [Candidatus Yanofskybacteria bacterium]